MGLAQCLAHSVCSINVVGIYCYWQLLPRWQVVKDPPANAGDTWDPWVQKIFWNRKWQPTPVFLPGNPTDREAWRARVHRVTRSRIWLSGVGGHIWAPPPPPPEGNPTGFTTRILPRSRPRKHNTKLTAASFCRVLCAVLEETSFP